MFSTRDNLYFVFAGEGDRYYLDSMLQMGVRGRLYLELELARYDRVCFVEDIGNRYAVRLFDEETRSAWNAGQGPWFPRRPSIPENETRAETDARPMRRWITECLTGASAASTAVVCSPETFTSLFGGDGAESVKQLAAIIDRPSNKNSLILLWPSRLREEQHLMLVDPTGVFARQTPAGASLCPALREMIFSDRTCEVLQELKNRIGSDFVELDAVTYPRLQALMRCVRFEKGEDWTEDELAEYTNYLYNWYYLPEITRKHTLPEGFIRMWDEFACRRDRPDIFRGLFDTLCRADGWLSFTSRVAVSKQDANRKVRETFLYSLNRPELEARCQVFLADDVLAEIARLPWPEYLYPSKQEARRPFHTADRGRWVRMQASLMKPNNRVIPEKRLAWLRGYVGSYRRALQAGDADTACRALNAMIYGGTYLYAEGDYFDFDKRFEVYGDCLQTSEDYHRIMANVPVSTGQTLSEAGMAAWQGKRLMYEKKLAAQDQLLSVVPEMAKSLDVWNVTDQAADSFAAFDDGPITVGEDEALPTAEEAEAWLRNRTLPAGLRRS